MVGDPGSREIEDTRVAVGRSDSAPSWGAIFPVLKTTFPFLPLVIAIKSASSAVSTLADYLRAPPEFR
jgi:hypothetical protein